MGAPVRVGYALTNSPFGEWPSVGLGVTMLGLRSTGRWGIDAFRGGSVLGCGFLRSSPRLRPRLRSSSTGTPPGRARRERARARHCSPTGRAASSTACWAWGVGQRDRPDPSSEQVEFELDRSGGYNKYKRDYWKTFGSRLRPLRRAGARLEGRRLPRARRFHWALQPWQRALSELRDPADGKQAVWELRLSHWNPASWRVLTVKTDWAYRRFDHRTARTRTSDGSVSTASAPQARGAARHLRQEPLPRHLQLELRARLEAGEQLPAHRTRGTFCYGFFPHGARPAGRGTKYRATIIGPGVTPDVFWEGPAPGAYDRAADQAANDEQRSAYRDGVCKIN